MTEISYIADVIAIRHRVDLITEAGKQRLRKGGKYENRNGI